jgi:2-polyprenyl-6-hydroxyphenyl methylase/3-demethylubiquinone-9 3-methyltransferase
VAGYYDQTLAAERLKRVYDIAPPRIRQYLQAEIDHVVSRINPGDRVLDLGCGYGRTVPALAVKAAAVIGIDASLSSLRLGQQMLRQSPGIHLACMNAVQLGFPDGRFDVVVCIQNGISAFHVDRLELVGEGLRVAKTGGRVLFSTYAASFWDERLAWFELQAAEGLLGEIDYVQTGNGKIVCKDGFTGTTATPKEFLTLCSELGVHAELTEVDDSSLFCEMTVSPAA